MHRWLACGEHDVPQTQEWLSPREAAWLDTIRFTKRRTEYLLRRWTAKRAVAVALGLGDPASLARIEIANRPSGAPYVVVDGDPVDLHLSLSDRAGWAVSLVGTGISRLGIDLEVVEPRSDGFVADFLTAAEQEYVGSPAALQPMGLDRDAAANLLWSAKESALKVLQTGLRRDTRSVEVSLGPVADRGWGTLEVRPVEGGVFPGWWRRDGVFLLTTAADRRFDPPALLAGSADLTTAEPVHSWIDRPLA